jgi:hypothetical protein
MAESMDLVGNSWKLNTEQIGVQKTYHFKPYTKALVGDSPSCHFLARNFGNQEMLTTFG